MKPHNVETTRSANLEPRQRPRARNRLTRLLLALQSTQPADQAWAKRIPMGATGVAILLLLGVGVIMAINGFTHPNGNVYDAESHEVTMLANQSLSTWKVVPCPPAMDYNPPLYYYLFGKLHGVIALCTGSAGHPFQTARIVHILIIMFVAVLYVFFLFPKFEGRSVWHRLWMPFALFTMPNIFLAQVMVRSDHLLFLAVQGLFVAWYYFDFPEKFAQSNGRQLVWAVCLVFMANSRHSALPAFVFFFGWGGLLFLRHFKTSSTARIVGFASLTTVLVILSGWHYGGLALNKGRVGMDNEREYLRKYEERESKPDFSRIKMFFNMQFDRLYKKPNRFVKFTPGNSAFFPRLYGDQWADHWLYFSGNDVHSDLKENEKRRVLVSAIPFTLLYFGTVLLSAVSGIRRLMLKQRIVYHEAAAFLFLGGLAFLALFAVMIAPIPGKNSTTKFIYIMAYYWLPILCMGHFLQKHRVIRIAFLLYTVVLFVLALPLSLFPVWL